jgi:hypothetical protein
MEGHTPLLGVDVWSTPTTCATRTRPEYLEAWWNVVNWPRVAKQLAAVGRTWYRSAITTAGCPPRAGLAVGDMTFYLRMGSP